MKMNTLYFIIFLAIVLSIYSGLNYYVYIKVTRGLNLSAKPLLYARIFFLTAALSFVAGNLLTHYSSFYYLSYPGNIWFGVLGISFSIFLLKDIVRLAFRFNNYSMTIGAIVLILLVASFSLFNYSRFIVFKEIEIPVSKLPDKLSGFTIIQLSDLHLDASKSSKRLSYIVEETNKANPDLIVITGDLMDEDICKAGNICNILGKLKSKYGVIIITGNHEFYAGIDAFLRIAKQLGFSVLRNAKTTIADSIELAGVDDEQGNRFNEKGKDLESAIKGCDFSKPVILLSHRPTEFDKAVKLGVDLQLSGHTHVGQVPPMDLIVMLIYKYPYGLYKRGSSYIYTTSGTGIWGPPMRLFSRSEIVKIILKKP
jgi:predicted MPP superfamily phosphohydrolase